MNYLKRDDEENDSRYSNRLMEIIKNVNSNEEINTNTISNVNDINPKTGFSNRLTNILENTVGLDDYYKNQEKIIGVKNNIDNILKSKTNEQVDNKNVVDIEPIENKEQSQQEFETKKVSDVKSTQNISDKTKQEIDKEVKKATSQNIQLNTTQNNTNSITGNNVKIGLASQSDTQNAQELSMEDIQVAKEAKKKNENIKKGGLAKFEETLDTFFDNILGGVKQTISGLANIVTTGIGLGLKGLAGSSYILGLENTGKALDKAYNNTIEAGSNINEIANHERSVNSQVDDDFTRTVGDVTNVISNMMSSQVIGYAIPSNISGTAIQGLSVGGNSAQEVLDENKDNIKEATLTGIAKGYTSYLTEKMFDANILTKGTKKSSIQKSVDKLISDKVSSRFGKEISNVTVGIIGENIEELVEDNTDNLIDKLINNKDLPGFKEWWNNTTETVKITTLSTLIMNMIGLGGESFHDKEIDLESDYWLDQAQQIIEQEDLAIHFNPSEVKSLNDTKDFYITRFTPDNNIANVVATRGKSISNPNENLKIKPAIVKDNITNFYTIIDEDTGIVLDSTPYETTIEAESVFNEKINKLSDLQIRDINQKVDKANYTINNEFTKVISQAKNEISQMTPADYEINVNENLKQNQEKKRQNFENLYKTINQISDKSLYNKTDVNTLLNTVSNNIDNVEYVPEDNGGGILYSFDDDKNITTQQDIKGNIYTGKKIKNIVNTAIQNADITNLYQETDIGSTQTSSEQNASTFYSNETNYAVQDIKKVTEPFNKQSDYSKEEMADIWNDEISNNNYDAYYGQDGNIERYIAIEEDGDNIVVNQYDNNDNLVKSEVIASENGRYKASDIQDTIDRVASLYDENRPIKGQQDIEGNEVMSMKKKTNSTKNADIIKSIEKFSNAKKSISRQDIINVATSLNIYHRGTTFLDDNIYKKSGHTERSKIVKIDEYFTDYTNKEELRKQAYNYALQNYKNEVVTIKDSNLQIDISQSGIKKTFGKNQDNDKMQTAPKLVDIINESVYLNSSISTKNSSLK